MYERSYAKQTPLHLAVGWPRGIEILFEESVEVALSLLHLIDWRNLTLLDYALCLLQTESAKLLLDRHALISTEYFKYWSLPLTHKPHLEFNNKVDRMYSLMASAMAERRQLVLESAMKMLPESMGTGTDLPEGPLMDEEVLWIEARLRHHGISIPRKLRYHELRPGAVYHWPYMTTSLAQKLFEAGFRTMSTPRHGHYPLMGAYYVEVSGSRSLEDMFSLITWFELHGASLNAPLPMCPHTSG